MYGIALSTVTLLALGSLFGTGAANVRWKMTEYEDIGCDDFLGTFSATTPSGCHNINHSVKTLSLKAEGSNARCGWQFTAFAGPNCDGDHYGVVQLIDGQCSKLSDSSAWGSWRTDPNPCP
ncbi:hypothetical protein F5Y13DRAFT_164466 [Hypoxylon sp. FL1857]|nr:hypothetical protein F5Y13DRAFT_164466 [Hypoxylon sp. FL1857]